VDNRHGGECGRKGGDGDHVGPGMIRITYTLLSETPGQKHDSGAPEPPSRCLTNVDTSTSIAIGAVIFGSGGLDSFDVTYSPSRTSRREMTGWSHEGKDVSLLQVGDRCSTGTSRPATSGPPRTASRPYRGDVKP